MSAYHEIFGQKPDLFLAIKVPELSSVAPSMVAGTQGWGRRMKTGSQSSFPCSINKRSINVITCTFRVSCKSTTVHRSSFILLIKKKIIIIIRMLAFSDYAVRTFHISCHTKLCMRNFDLIKEKKRGKFFNVTVFYPRSMH